VADRDNDKKVFWSEVIEYVERRSEASSGRIVMDVADRDRSLFENFDADHDRRLRLRELLRGPDQILAFDQDGDGRITRENSPHRYRLEIGRGDGPSGIVKDARPALAPDPAVNPESSDLTWFLATDRNSGGDVSPREFLGTAAQCRGLDTNSGGLVDASEANKTAKTR
jgi:hypothetical protein